MEQAKTSLFQRIPHVWKSVIVGMMIGGLTLLVMFAAAKMGFIQGRVGEWVFLIAVLTLFPTIMLAGHLSLPDFAFWIIYILLWGGPFAVIGVFTKGKSKKTFWIMVALLLLFCGLLELAIISWTPWGERGLSDWMD